MQCCSNRWLRPRTRLTLTTLVLSILLIALSGVGAWAQSTQGSILGTVKDVNGAAIVGATVTLTNTDAGVVRTTKTSSSGDYQFLDAVPASYNVEVTFPGFEAWKLTGGQLTARQQLRVDVSLSVGGVQQTVQVSGDNASAIETDTPSINAVYSADDAVNLPTNSRASSSGTSGLSLIGTLPGVQTDQGSYALQGGLPFQTEVSVDGITVQSATGNSPIADALPSTDAISELRADGVQNNAEFGQPGEVTITSKGGTNKIHGSAYWYFQNQDFDAIQYGDSSKPHKVGNTFGGRFSGPVVIPHLYDGHDKLFIYGGYEGYRFPQQTGEQYVVPTAAMKTGDFTNYNVIDPTTGNPVPLAGLFDPFSGAPIGPTLPSTTLNSIAQKFLQFYPDPNHGNTASYTTGQAANYYVNQDASQHSDQFDIRPDKYFGANQKFLLWGRFSHKNFPANSPEPLNVPSSQNTNQNNTLTTSFNWTIKPTLINEFKFGFTLTKTGTSNSFDGKSFTEASGLQGLQNLFYNGLPELDFGHLQGLTADRLTSITQSKTYVYHDVSTLSKGKHTIKFGVDIDTLEALTPLGFNGADNYGTFYYYASGEQGGFTGVDFADFLIGVPDATFYDVVQQDNDGKSSHYHFFGQDEWKATPRLTLSYGLRYELHPGYYDPNGDIGNFDPSVALSGRAIYPNGKSALLAQGFLAAANACDADGVHNTNSAVVNGAPCMPVETNSQAGYPSGLKKYPHLRFMPRFGFAYRLFGDDKTVVRGGYGLYNITVLGSSFYSLTGTLQAQTQQFNNTYNPATHAIGYQWPVIYAGAGGAAGVGGYGSDYFGTANSTNWKDPYTGQWSLSLDHDFGGGYAARASYIGSETHDLIWAPDENTLPFSSTVSANNQPQSARLFPNWGRINTRATGANASYHSLQLDASHRFQHGFQADSSFTWAKALADNQGPNNSGFASENGGQRSTSILDRKADFGNVGGTRRLLWNTTALYDLPIGRGRKFGSNMPRILDAAVGGWRISNIFNLQSGAYLTPYFAAGEGDPSGTGSGLTSTLAGWDPSRRAQHPDSIQGVNWKPAGQNRNNWVNASAFTCPGLPGWTVGSPCTTGAGYDSKGNAIGASPLPIGRFGDTEVGSIEGPHFVNLNSGLVKTFSVTERVKLRAEGTFTNVLNHINLDESSLAGHLDLSTSSFGQITSGLPGRVGQVSMRLEF